MVQTCFFFGGGEGGCLKFKLERDWLKPGPIKQIHDPDQTKINPGYWVGYGLPTLMEGGRPLILQSLEISKIMFSIENFSKFCFVKIFQFKCYDFSLYLASEECTSVHDTICNAK